MASRVRFGLTVSGLLLLLVGFAAIAFSVLNVFSGFESSSTSFGDDGSYSYSGPSRTAIALSTLLPVGGAVALVLGVVCLVGAIASLVATEAVDRAAAKRIAQPVVADHATGLSAPETLEG